MADKKTPSGPIDRVKTGPGAGPAKSAGTTDLARSAGPADPAAAEREAAERKRGRAGFITSIAVTALAIGALIWRLGS
ncbi:hypothetical protein [Chthonobacter rhizosphaerae]|uniref:hypothetical protein n=1 Tax=Chthonobacter rhizosphaerae TaxID=2735553 RepID=UPI0015EE9DC8|nr:hypothetical protein [Chthonobacter rhizosphaerae]